MAKIRIIFKVDDSCDMASVCIDGRHKQLPKKLLHFRMEGNFWDFHPGCHGMYQYGDWNGVGGLVDVLRREIEKLGHSYVVDHEEYKYC